jgi:hypothetical protein
MAGGCERLPEKIGRSLRYYRARQSIRYLITQQSAGTKPEIIGKGAKLISKCRQ